MQSESINELATALAVAQGTMGVAAFDRTNPHYKNKYASLASTIDAIRKPLSENGLSITQTTHFRDGMFLLVTTLRHASGQWVASEYPLPMMAKPQEMGSALTYARRYEVSAIVSIASDDDDDDDGEGTRKTASAANGGGSEIISLAQVEQLQRLIVEVAADIPKFCKYMEVERIEMIPVAQFDNAIAALKMKAQKQ